MKPIRLLPFLAAIAGLYSLRAEEKPLSIGWANLQWPPATNHVLNVTNRTANIYGQVWIDGVTSKPGATPNLLAQLGFGPAGSNPLQDTNWVWTDALFNLEVGNNDEFMGTILPEKEGMFDYLYRYSTTRGSKWLYADLKGPVADGQLPANPGKLTVKGSDDTTRPSTPFGLVIAGASPDEIKLSWLPVSGDKTLYGYEVLRGSSAGGPYSNIARTTNNSFADRRMLRGKTNFYVVRAVDLSFNRSFNSLEVAALAEPSISVTFDVTVPAGSTNQVYLAGTFAGLNGAQPEWDPGAVPLTRVDSTHWSITLCGKEGTQISYKYTLGAWDNVEKGRECDEINDRQVTLKLPPADPLAVHDTVANWRNIAPCKDP